MTVKATTLALAALSITSAAALFSTSATADVACQARAGFATPTRSVDFEALYAQDSGTVGFLWNFGDGTSSTGQNPTHTYASDGIYRATLTVTDLGTPQQVCRDTVEVPVGVIVEPNCWGLASTRWGDASLGVQFDCGGRNFPDPPPYRFVWSFGDGSTTESTESCSAYHVYSAGTYWAAFWIQTSVGNTLCSTLRITAIDNPTPVRKSAWGRVKLLYR